MYHAASNLQVSTRHLLVTAEDRDNASPHHLGALGGIDTRPDTSLAVVVHYRSGLLVVGSQPLSQGLNVVIGPLDKGLSGDIICHVLFGRVEFSVVGPSGCRVDESTSDSGNQKAVRDLKLKGLVKLLLVVGKHGIELLGLYDSSGETIENESAKSENLSVMGN